MNNIENLVQRAKGGNVDAFSKLIEEIQLELYNIAKVKISNETDINDVIQDTILDIYVGIKKLKDDKLFKTWAIRILLNNCNNVLKHKYKNKNVISFEQYIEGDFHNGGKNIIEDTHYKFNFEDIMKILSEHEKIIFTLYYQESYKIDEISEILQERSNTIKSILKRGREKIKKNFKEMSNYE